MLGFFKRKIQELTRNEREVEVNKRLLQEYEKLAIEYKKREEELEETAAIAEKALKQLQASELTIPAFERFRFRIPVEDIEANFSHYVTPMPNSLTYELHPQDRE